MLATATAPSNAPGAAPLKAMTSPNVGASFGVMMGATGVGTGVGAAFRLPAAELVVEGSTGFCSPGAARHIMRLAASPRATGALQAVDERASIWDIVDRSGL